MNRCPSAVLTHHDVVRLAAPFLHAGWQVDLQASDRHAGRVRLCPPAGGPDAGASVELRHHGARGSTLLRAVQRGALKAKLAVHAREPAQLHAALAAWPPATQWREGPGWQAALSHEGEATAPRLRAATLQVHGMQMRMAVPAEGARSARVELRSLQGRSMLPDDLMAVLGWHWSTLIPVDGAWHGSVRLPRRNVPAGQGAECRLLEAATHLARTLGESPTAFHRRMRAARWRVLVRRAVPLALWGGLIGLVAAAPSLHAARHTLWPLLVLVLPTAMVLHLCASQGGRAEWPPLPRPLRRASW